MLHIFSVHIYTQLYYIKKEKDKICMLNPEIKLDNTKSYVIKEWFSLIHLLKYSFFWPISESDESLSSEE